MNGTVKVDYKQSGHRQKGRFYCKNGIGLQSMYREIRNTICNEYYHDVDIVNCMPTILYQYCEKNQIPNEHLRNYAENRDELLKNLMETNKISRDEAKTIILCLTNGGVRGYRVLKSKPDWLKDLKEELEEIRDAIVKINPDEEQYQKRKRDKTFSISGSVLSSVLCNIENFIYLMAF
eukprot:m.238742 g.238742  ORF g.238742 m.238742 type:complete len:178 (-) comp16061_c0_seq9:972-1505(-)